MLKHSFCILDGVAERKEQEFWSKGICSWDDFHQKGHKYFEVKWFQLWAKQIQQLDDLIQSNPLAGLPLVHKKWHWRFFPLLRKSVGYLDLEMTKVDGQQTITCASLWDGSELFQYIAGKNLSELVSKIMSKDMIITYGGKKHDFPLLSSQLDLKFEGLHLDLSDFLKLIGVRGGLKNCEKHFDIDRGPLNKIDGLDAIWLWGKYNTNGGEKYLQLLLQYNGLDAINLELLMIRAWNQMTYPLPFKELVHLTEDNLTKIYFEVDQSAVSQVLQSKVTIE